MKLKEFFDLVDTYHIKAIIIESDKRQREIMLDHIDNKYDDYEILRVDCTTEVEKETLITHTISIRPILLVTIKEII